MEAVHVDELCTSGPKISKDDSYNAYIFVYFIFILGPLLSRMHGCPIWISHACMKQLEKLSLNEQVKPELENLKSCYLHPCIWSSSKQFTKLKDKKSWCFFFFFYFVDFLSPH